MREREGAPASVRAQAQQQQRRRHRQAGREEWQARWTEHKGDRKIGRSGLQNKSIDL